MAYIVTSITKNDSPPVSKYDHAVTICNSLALIMSQCTMDQFVVRLKLLSQLQLCWSKGYCVVLKLDSGVALEELVGDTCDDDMDMKPDLEIMASESQSPMVKGVSANIGGRGDETDGSNGGYETDDYEYFANDDKVRNVTDTSAAKNDDTPTWEQSDQTASKNLPSDSLVHCATCKMTAVPHHHCTMCKKAFQTLAGLTLHMQHKHKELTEEYTCKTSAVPHLHCTMCKKAFQTAAGLTLHKRHKHKEQEKSLALIDCTMCDAKFSYRRGIVQHMRLVHNKDGEIDLLGSKNEYAGQSEEAAKKKPKKQERSLPLIKCTMCAARFCHRRGMLRHMYHSHNKVMEEDDVTTTLLAMDQRKKAAIDKSNNDDIDLSEMKNDDTASAAPSLDRIEDTTTENLPPGDLHCPECNKLCRSTGALDRHRHCKHRVAVPEKSPDFINCTMCSSRFRYRRGLLQHLRDLHKKGRKCPIRRRQRFPNYVCESCGTTFEQSRSFIRHMKDFHTIKIISSRIDDVLGPTLNYQCRKCQRILLSQQSLRHHICLSRLGMISGNQATNDNSYKRSKSRHLQVEHSRTKDIQMTSEQQFAAQQWQGFPNILCASCGITFSHGGNFIRHMRDFHKTEMSRSSLGDLQCPICQKNLESRYRFFQHMRMHGIDAEEKHNLSTSVDMKDYTIYSARFRFRRGLMCHLQRFGKNGKRAARRTNTGNQGTKVNADELSESHHLQVGVSGTTDTQMISGQVNEDNRGSADALIDGPAAVSHMNSSVTTFNSFDSGVVPVQHGSALRGTLADQIVDYNDDEQLNSLLTAMDRKAAVSISRLKPDSFHAEDPVREGMDQTILDINQVNEDIAPGSVPHDRLMQLLPSSDIYTYNVMTYISDDSSTPGSFDTIFRVNMNRKEEFSEWLKLFQTKNSTQLNILRGGSNKGRRVAFKRYLKCIHCVTGGTIGKGKHTGCPTRMTVAIDSISSNGTASKIASQPFDAGCVISLLWAHNHPLLAADTLRQHTVAPEVDQKVAQLLRHEHSVRSALKCIEMEINDIAMGESGASECTITPRSLLPDYKHCYYIYKTQVQKECGDAASNGGLPNFVEDVNKTEGEICVAYEEFQGSNLIAICMPFMKRVHQQIPESGEIVYLESSGEMHKGKSGYHVYLLMTHSSAGALPLAVGITPSESAEHLTRLFNLIKAVIPTDSFYSRGSVSGPMLFMTDDNMTVRSALFNVWPQSRPMLCQFHILQSQWRWLLSSQNLIDPRERPALFAWVKKLIYMPTEIESSVQFERFQYDPLVVKYNAFRDQIIGLFMRRDDWCTALLPSELPHVTHVNNYVEASMRALKYHIFEQTHSFKLLQMVNFLTEQFSTYYKRRLEDCSSNRQCRPPAKFPKYEGQAIIEVSEDIYDIVSSKDMNVFYTVNTAATICTCNEWETGYMCKHLHYVFTHRKAITTVNNVNDFSGLMYRVATGRTTP